MKATNQKVYESPKAEVIAIERHGVLCGSGAASTSTNAGGGATQMHVDNGIVW